MRPKLNDWNPAGLLRQKASPTQHWLSAEQISIPDVVEPSSISSLRQLHFAAGIPPYLRGPYASMYLQRPWT
ncbi:MAG: methylmalonyl-CoA mutase, partial [Cyclobacteriaceae bacterium]|nr:methylmalonyl-CoA mutase [Cyclobacteriaceae bacterium]